MQDITILGISISPWIILPVIYLVWLIVLFIIKNVFFTVIRRIASKTKTQFDDIFIKSIDFPLTILIFTSGALLVEKIMPALINESLTGSFLLIFKASTILAIILFIDKFLNALLKEYAGKIDILRSSGGVVRGFVRVVVISLGILILLDSFGISITPIIASLGIGSLAIALALQPTLENLFSGIQLIIDKPIQVGQFIKLESGEEGYVDRIGWRSTWVRMLPNNTVVIPNKTLVNSRVTNYYYPQKELAVLVQVGVHYESDLEQVEKVTIEVGKETLKDVNGGVAEFAPFIRYHTFADFSINFTVILRAKEFVDNYLIKHEFIKRLHKRYAQEGITIPYPIAAINYDQEKNFSANTLSVKVEKN